MELHPVKPQTLRARAAIKRHLDGDIILPELLRDLQELGPVSDADRLGTVVLATLPGDAHDIGAALLTTILACAGYVVHDLGRQVAIETIINAAVELNADA